MQVCCTSRENFRKIDSQGIGLQKKLKLQKLEKNIQLNKFAKPQEETEIASQSATQLVIIKSQGNDFLL